MKDYQKYRVRVKDSLGELHTIFAYGRTDGEAKLSGLNQAKRLLQDPGVEIMWLKPYNK